MSYESVAASILITFKSDFSVAFPAVPIEDDNGELKNKDEVDSWVRISIREGITDQITIAPVGSREWQTDGVVIVQLFSRTGLGAGVVREMVTVVRDIFRGRRIGEATFRGVSLSYQNSGDVWFQQNLVTPFFNRDVK